MRYQTNTFVFFIILFAVCLAACNKTEKSSILFDKSFNNHSKGYLLIESSKYNFGVINKKQKNVHCQFKLKNIGKKSIIINKIDVSCNCVSIIKYPKLIAPNETQILYVNVNTKNQSGYFNKVIYINSNADNPLELVRIKGEIQ